MQHTHAFTARVVEWSPLQDDLFAVVCPDLRVYRLSDAKVGLCVVCVCVCVCVCMCDVCAFVCTCVCTDVNYSCVLVN